MRPSFPKGTIDRLPLQCPQGLPRPKLCKK
jgi:hypothetical protein